MKSLNILILAGLLSTRAYSDELLAPFQFGFGAAVSSINDDIRENESLGYELSLGYQFNENVLLETAYADYQFTSMNVTPWITRLKGILPVSEYAALYLGGGVAVDNQYSAPLLSGGVKYQMSKNWELDAGYQSIFKIEPNDSTITSLLISVIYKPSLESYTPSIYRPEEKVFKETQKKEKQKPEPVITLEPEVIDIKPTETETETETETVCTVESKKYKIKEGDHLYKIARENDMSFRDLLKLNEDFVKKQNQDLVYPGEVVNLKYNSCVTGNTVKKNKPVETIKIKNKEKNCSVGVKEYRLKHGDYLYKIARNNDMSFGDLLELNEEFVVRQDKDLVYPGEFVNLNYYICK